MGLDFPGSSYSLTYRTSIAGGFQLLDNTWSNQHNMSSSWTIYALHHGSFSGKLGHQKDTAGSSYGSRYINAAGQQTDWPVGCCHL